MSDFKICPKCIINIKNSKERYHRVIKPTTSKNKPNKYYKKVKNSYFGKICDECYLRKTKKGYYSGIKKKTFDTYMEKEKNKKKIKKELEEQEIIYNKPIKKNINDITQKIKLLQDNLKKNNNLFNLSVKDKNKLTQKNIKDFKNILQLFEKLSILYIYKNFSKLYIERTKNLKWWIEKEKYNFIEKPIKKKKKQQKRVRPKIEPKIKINTNVIEKAKKIIDKTPKKDKEIVKQDIIMDLTSCTAEIDAILNKIYSGRYVAPKSIINSKEYWEEIKNKKQLYSEITSFEFFPTPPQYANLIYNNVINTYYRNHFQYIDIGSGLASLALPFIFNKELLNIDSIILIEINKQFLKLLKCFEKNKNIKVLDEDFLKIESKKLIKSKEIVITMNPPFNMKSGKHFLKRNYYLWFIYKVLNYFNKVNFSLYVICPARFFKRGKLDYTKFKLHDLVVLEPPKATIKNIEKDLKIKLDNDTIYSEFEYLGKVTEFQGLNKRGNVRKSGDAYLFKYEQTIV